MKDKITIGVGSAMVGFALGFYISKQRLEAQYQKDIAEFKEHYAKAKEVSEEEEVYEDMVTAYTGDSGLVVPEEDPEDEFEDPFFIDPDPEDVFEESLSKEESTSDKAYLITGDQFETEAPTYDKETLFYYAGDGAVTDEDEVPMDSDIIEETIGEQFILGLNRVNMVYVRNDHIQSDFTIHKLDGSFAEISSKGETPKEREERLAARNDKTA